MATLMPPPDDRYERALRAEGWRHIAGIDEAGRGALAGPVVAAAVILPPGELIDGVRDSKQISEEKREELYEIIAERAIAWSCGIVEADRIDEINILQATFVAMRRAVEGLSQLPDGAIIDGRDAPDVGVPRRALIKGDTLCLSIAAASIMAKVTRDRIMRRADPLYPAYGFHRHKGYGTAAHRDAIRLVGPCEMHRRTFLRGTGIRGQGTGNRDQGSGIREQK